MYLRRLTLALTFALLAWLPTSAVLAVEVSLHTPDDDPRVDEPLQIGVVMATGDDSVNAIEGVLLFDAERFSVARLSTGGSVVSFWLEEPYEAAPGRLAFSGVIPGGYRGAQGLLLTITLTPRSAGAAELAFETFTALRHDGMGTALTITAPALMLDVQTVDDSAEAIPLPSASVREEDSEAPESFTPEIAADPTLFDGQWFLVFATTDKGSGIARYDVQEGNGAPVEATSPYLLRHQGLQRDITVTAYDHSGNTRAAIVPAVHPRPDISWAPYAVLSAVLLMLVLALTIRRTCKS